MLTPKKSSPAVLAYVAMNYRHSFHAGNFADCVKHAVLLELLRALAEKKVSGDVKESSRSEHGRNESLHSEHGSEPESSAPAMHFFETHAGRGRYALDVLDLEHAEWHGGIGKLYGVSGLAPELHRYVERIKSVNHGELAVYPGSPMLAAARLRGQDRLELCELEPTQAQALTELMHKDRRVRVHQGDGYALLKAHLPPTIKRGLVLIDPPYERDDEFAAIAHALHDALKRWATGVYAVWYPIKNGRELAPFYRSLAKLSAKNVLIGELCIHPDVSDLRLNGCGMAILNAPYRFEQSLERTLKPLHRLLRVETRSRVEVKWLKRAE
jgi:23S rRNA (adenine2030-N6)-methyltransferase